MGSIDTDLMRHMTAEARQKMVAAIDADQPEGVPKFRFKGVPQGAATSI